MRCLVVGDPHIVEPELKDGQALVDYVCRVARETKPDHIVLLGDLFHTHNIVHLEIQEFWARSIAQMAKLAHVIVINGNHDSPHHKLSKASANRPFGSIPNVDVVIDRVHTQLGMVFAPFCHTEAELLDLVHAYQDRVLFCHNTFLGAKYENGMYAKDGFDAAKFKNPLIVSGHIHTKMSFGKVIYPGPPRWRTAADANQSKAIVLMEFEGTKLVRSTDYPTDTVCRPIFKLVDTESAPLSVTPVKNAKYFIEIRGTPAWCEARKGLYPWAKVSVFPTHKAIKVRESDGIGVAFRSYLADYQPKHGTSATKLTSKLSDLLTIL